MFTDEELIQADTADLKDEVEALESRLELLASKAESGEQWAEICRIEAQELRPLKDHLRRCLWEIDTAIHADSQFGVGA